MMFGGEIMFQLANVFMRFMGSADFWQKWFGGDKDLSPTQTTWLDSTYGWVETIYKAIMRILVPILAIVAAAGIIWAIVLGVQMARADSTEKREEAKKTFNWSCCWNRNFGCFNCFLHNIVPNNFEICYGSISRGHPYRSIKHQKLGESRVFLCNKKGLGGSFLPKRFYFIWRILKKRYNKIKVMFHGRQNERRKKQIQKVFATDFDCCNFCCCSFGWGLNKRRRIQV